MKNCLVSCILLAFLTGCGSSGGSDSVASTTGGGTTGGTGGTGGETSRALVKIDGVNSVVTVSHAEPIDLLVSGVGNTVTVLGSVNIGSVKIIGSGQQVTLRIGTACTSVHMTGVNQTLHLPAGSTPVITNEGTGCVVVYDSTSG